MYLSETTKYQIHANFEAEGIVEKSDVIGAIFGQTEGILGDDLDLRDLQRSGRLGRIDVRTESRKGQTKGEITIYSSIDKVETALLAASLETIERVGPCASRFAIRNIEDIRISKRKLIISRAKELLTGSFEECDFDTNEILDEIREHSRIEKVIEYGPEKLPSGPNVVDSDAIIVVEGRADVINLLRYGIKNAIAVEGTNVPASIIELCEKKTATAFMDGDRGGDLIISELLQVADIDFIAVSPRGKNVEEMTRKEIIKPLRNKIPAELALTTEGRLDTNMLSLHSEKMKKEREEEKKVNNEPDLPQSEKILRGMMKEVREQNIVKFLSVTNETISEFPSDEIEAALKKTDDNISGIVTGRTVDQNLLDLIAMRKISLIAAPDFRDIVKKPVSVKLMKINQL
ncbi:DNA primase DnaG [Methanoplanus endosymbiosus]|uniref:DNA primase DnaG n=1 Tax=Methanoplanus endosymbiosus TaxID=33865 RepID=A0A9E7PLH1_9EURY|nr:DNA primase DnaG [Methanoplanus endosymbiosus]UUX92344.1 DNA primase DnaG [Methanoplanus endosymbiosus]